MDDETKKRNIEQVQIDNNYPGLERLVKLGLTKYPDDISRRDVKRFLANDAITQQTKVQQQPRKKADEPGGHITAFQPNELWNVDIFVMLRYKKVNDGFNYFRVAIDVFTRKAYGVAMKTKDSISSREAISTIITSANKPRSILIDNDAGFLSSDGGVGETFSTYLEKQGIALQTNALKDHKAMGIIDNFALRLRKILSATSLKENSVRWIGQVDKILERYNNSPNSAIADITPNDASKEANNQTILDLNTKKNQGNKTVSDLKPEDKVRVNLLKNDANAKGSDPKWSAKVHTVKATQGKTITLDSNVRHKRHDLLKVPHDAEDLPKT
jgi:transposase InsO family protein